MIISIITIFIAILIRIWISRQLFNRSDKVNFLWASSSAGVWVIIMSLPHFINRYYPLPPHRQLYITSILTILITISIRNKPWIFGRIFQSIVRIVSSSIPTNGSYSISARSEESCKRSYIKKYTFWPIPNIILLSIVSGIAFWRVENILYLIMGWIYHHDLLTIISQRSFFPIIIHAGAMAISSSVILALHDKLPLRLGRATALWSGIVIHYLFNIAQSQGRWWMTFPLITVSIITITYAFAQSDLLYIPQPATEKEST